MFLVTSVEQHSGTFRTHLFVQGMHKKGPCECKGIWQNSSGAGVGPKEASDQFEALDEWSCWFFNDLNHDINWYNDILIRFVMTRFHSLVVQHVRHFRWHQFDYIPVSISSHICPLMSCSRLSACRNRIRTSPKASAFLLIWRALQGKWIPYSPEWKNAG